MAKYVTKIRTKDGDLPIDYNSLANLPTFEDFATNAAINEVSESVDGLSKDVAELSSAVADETNRAKGVESGLNSRLQTVESTIGETGSMSSAIADAVANAKEYTDTAVNSVNLIKLGVTATEAELNVLDGVKATTTELNHLDGVTSNVQAQLDAKAGADHKHDYLPLSGGTLTGIAAVASSAVRNIQAGTTSMTSGSSVLTTGTIYIQYE